MRFLTSALNFFTKQHNGLRQQSLYINLGKNYVRANYPNVYILKKLSN
ncbi:hypothetical protein ALT1545_170054 [Alteromonas macleodii]